MAKVDLRRFPKMLGAKKVFPKIRIPPNAHFRRNDKKAADSQKPLETAKIPTSGATRSILLNFPESSFFKEPLQNSEHPVNFMYF
ncbi:MAG: hypothetical protein NZ602_04930 [Thermoguttaceae bacterium]|nr:hypothetical protein [Thermoguttaceae bacterium]MDW8038044.1 hypothetical protein [Thermoguttaceae bacterium]